MTINSELFVYLKKIHIPPNSPDISGELEQGFQNDLGTTL